MNVRRSCRRPATGVLAVIVCAVTACAPRLYQHGPTTSPPAGEIDTRLVLVGDGGDEAGRSVLSLLQHTVRGSLDAGIKTTVLFLGDNVYPDGLVPTGGRCGGGGASPAAAGERAAGERILTAQLTAAAPAPTLVIPGNHDWNDSRADGLARLCAAEDFITEAARTGVATHGRLVPTAGCPGPIALDLGRRVRLIVIDSEWLLRDGEAASRAGAPARCLAGVETDLRPLPANTPDAMLRELAALAASAGDRRVIVAAHHPLKTRGRHGSWTRNFGPLSRAQDAGSGAYRTMADRLTRALAGTPPFAFVAGHDHSLQVLRGASDRSWQLISGAGQEATGIWPDPSDTVYAHQHLGFMVLDVFTTGDAYLEIRLPDAQGHLLPSWGVRLE